MHWDKLACTSTSTCTGTSTHPLSLGQGHSSPHPVKTLRLSSLLINWFGMWYFLAINPLSWNIQVFHVQLNWWGVVAIGTTSITVERLSLGWCQQYKCFMQIRHHPPTHILTGAVVRLNQYVSPHHPRIAYSQVCQREGTCKILGSKAWLRACVPDKIWEANQYDNIAHVHVYFG